MHIASSAEMSRFDQEAVEIYGLSLEVLMENAGAALARQAQLLLGASPGRIVVMAGGGNNGGDGFVAARHLIAAGCLVSLIITAPENVLSGASRANLDILRRIGLTPVTWPEGEEILGQWLQDCALVIDALLGTGLKGAAREPAASLIARINNSGIRVLSADLPSGVSSDDGQVPGPAIRADATVSFGLPKPAQFLYPAAGFFGQTTVEPIGFPGPLLNRTPGRAICRGTVRSLLPRRAPDAHKGNSGRVLVIGGSPGLSGALQLCARGALRSGAGLVTAAYPRSIRLEMASRLPEVMGLELPDGDYGGLTAIGLDLSRFSPDRLDAVAIGPGLGQTPETRGFIAEFLRMYRGPVIIDADALRVLKTLQRIGLKPERMIVTPHPGEMADMLDCGIREIQSGRIAAARRLAGEWGVITVLKGAGTVVACPDGSYSVNTTGNPGLATGGTGDVLAGLVTGLVAQGLPLCDAAVCGVYLHGLAGDQLARERSRGFLAGELADRIPWTWKEVEESS